MCGGPHPGITTLLKLLVTIGDLVRIDPQLLEPAGRPARVLGVLTVAYSVAALVAPKILAKPSGLTGPLGGVSTPVSLLIRALAARDIALGARMVFAAPGAELKNATLARAAADASDTVLFGIMLPTTSAKLKVAGFAAGWAAACAIAAVRADQ